jgi:hypothetical protein
MMMVMLVMRRMPTKTGWLVQEERETSVDAVVSSNSNGIYFDYFCCMSSGLLDFLEMVGVA